MQDFRPSYLRLNDEGTLDERIETLYGILQSCELCPRKCRVNRLNGETGFCGAPEELVVSSCNLHFGEEEPLVGSRSSLFYHPAGSKNTGGSGTIFLTYCNLLCAYCQNFDVSHLAQGIEVSIEKAAAMMLELQQAGAHNINFVTPTHFAPQLVKAVKIASTRGLNLPIVWNCGGYENIEIIRLLDGIVDIYMPDMKYSDSEPSKKYSKAPDYYERCTEAVREMHRQVGTLKLDERGIAQRGLLIRHLVLPNGLAGSEKILKFISEELSRESYVNVMSQYRPVGNARMYPELNRHPTWEEYFDIVDVAKKHGLTRGLQRKHLQR
jgi:putative pyruvate formate lyase activating enzyme